MSEIIQKWLLNRLGILFDLSADTFGLQVQSGRLVAELLYNYDIIEYDQLFLIRPTCETEEAIKNYQQHISVWLKSIGIDCSEQTLLSIVHGNGTAAIKLFYQLYLELEDKTKIHMRAMQKKREKMRPNDNRFVTISVSESTEDPSVIPNHPMSEPLISKHDVIEWHHDRYDRLLKECEENRDKYIKFLKNSFGVKYRNKFQHVKAYDNEDVNKTILPSEIDFREYTYEELLEQQKRAQEMEKFDEDTNVAKKIVQRLRQKRRKFATHNELKIDIQKMLLLELWEKVLAQQEKDFEHTISNKMLKQSVYEKQMAMKMFEVRQQKDNFLSHRRYINEKENQKRDFEFGQHFLCRDKSIEAQKYNYYFERDKMLELHRRLYAEKLRLRAERNYKMCKKIMQDISDIAIKHSEYTMLYEMEAPRRKKQKWIDLFLKEQPIFGLMPCVEDIVQPYLDNLPDDLEEIYSIELDRQNALDSREFESYCCYDWPWELERHLQDFEENLDDIVLGMNVLGHAVHRVLLTKYPKPPHPPKPNLPPFDVAACIEGLVDPTTLPVLQQFLRERKITVIEVEQAINFCLDAFKEETLAEYPDTVFITESELALEKLKGTQKKDKKKPPKGAKANKKKKKEIEIIPEEPKFGDKQNQTPLIYPGEEKELSCKADLGRIAYEVLNIGEPLNDYLIIAMIIEYLKSLENIWGWALINYPTTFEQAALLEEALTSIPVPRPKKKPKRVESIGDFVEIDYRETEIGERIDNNKTKRTSKILPNPIYPIPPPYYETYLTAFIRMRQHFETAESSVLSSPYVLPPSDIAEEETEHQIDPLDEFYMDQGCNYSLQYEVLNFDTIKHLAKLIIGEYKIPPKKSIELFGDTYLYMEANLTQPQLNDKASKSAKKGEKKPPPKEKSSKKAAESEPPSEKGKKAGKGDKADKKDKKDKKGGKKGEKRESVIITREDKEVQVPEPEEEVEEEIHEEEPEPRPGEIMWKYADVTIPDDFQIILATLWENAEEVYVNDFQQLFFIRRVLLDAIMPFIKYVKKHMRAFIARPDNKQTFLFKFQHLYNNMDDDIRDDAEFKAEMHCRIRELRNKLYEICDIRMEESEQERQRIIKQNWITTQMIEICNCYVTAFQLEIDRCTDSIQFLIDYFISEITKMPSDNDVVHKIILTKITSDESQDKLITVTFPDITNIVENLLTVKGTIAEGTPYHKHVEQNFQTAFKFVDTCYALAVTMITRMEIYFMPGKKPKPSKAGAGKVKLPKFLEPEEEVKEVGQRIIDEWKMATNGEVIRAKTRLLLIKSVANEDFAKIFDGCQKCFHTLFDEISERFDKEMNSINTACEVLARAVEAEIKLQPQLILDGPNFYIQPDVLLFPDPPIIPDVTPKENYERARFTIAQLDYFIDVLFDLAPNGSIQERSFVFILQDLISLDEEDGQPPMIPDEWKKLTPLQVPKLSIELFGHCEYINWKDFIIYNLCVPFPTEEELLEVRQQFRNDDPDITETVKDYQFGNVRFWFEKEFDDENPGDMYRLRLIKQILFRMYRIDEETLNYTSLLIAFCKDEDPIVGFAKALELSLGKMVCWDLEIGENYINSVLQKREYDEALKKQREEESRAAATEIITDLIDATVHQCDSVIIEDYVSEEEHLSQQMIIEEPPESVKDEEIVEPETESIIHHNSLDSVDPSASSTSIITEDKFSNVEIGFEVNENPPKAYFLPFEVILLLLTASLPWHARIQNLEDLSFRERVEVIYEQCKHPDFNDAVFVHQFLNNKFFKDILYMNNQFSAKYPPKIVIDLLENEIEEEEAAEETVD